MADSRGAARRTANEDLQNRGIRHAVYLQRLKAGTVNDIRGLLERDVLGPVERRLKARLAEIEKQGEDIGPLTTARLQALAEETRGMLRDGFDAALPTVQREVGAIAAYEAEWQLAALKAATPITWDFTAPSPVTMRALVESRPFEGAVMKDWWGGIAGDAQARVTAAVNGGIAEGATTQEIVSRIIGDDGLPGAALDVARHNVESVVRTAATHVSNAARQQTFKDNDDLVKGWTFVATLDDRCDAECGMHDGKDFEIGAGPEPPIHWGCRCSAVPLLKSLAELGFDLEEFPDGIRESMDGAVPEKLTFDDWLRGQDKAVQDEVLGPGRAAVYRDGRELAEFVDGTGSPLTLDELRARDAS